MQQQAVLMILHMKFMECSKHLINDGSNIMNNNVP